MKRFKSYLYTEGKFGRQWRRTLDTDNECLYSYGRYPTKIRKEDLPKDYLQIHSRSIWYMIGYLKTSGVVDIQYTWSRLGHLFKDDYVYISYKEKLQDRISEYGYKDYINYDICICGNDIIPIALAIETNSNIDITHIRNEIETKRIWFKENYFDEYKRQFGEEDVDLFEYWMKY